MRCAHIDADVRARQRDRNSVGRLARDELVPELAGCEGLRPARARPGLVGGARTGEVGADEASAARIRPGGNGFFLLHPVPARVPRFVLGGVCDNQVDRRAVPNVAIGGVLGEERVDPDVSNVHLMHGVGAGDEPGIDGVFCIKHLIALNISIGWLKPAATALAADVTAVERGLVEVELDEAAAGDAVS